MPQRERRDIADDYCCLSQTLKAARRLFWQRFSIYIRAATLNGQPFNNVFLAHGQLTADGQLNLEMDSGPNFLWAIGAGDRPPAPLSSVRSD